MALLGNIDEIQPFDVGCFSSVNVGKKELTADNGREVSFIKPLNTKSRAPRPFMFSAGLLGGSDCPFSVEIKIRWCENTCFFWLE